MNKTNKPKTIADIQLDQFLRELDTEEGRKRIGDDAFKEAKAAHDAWFGTKVQEALADPMSAVPHDKVMDDVQALIDKKRRA
ncbi:MAG: type II toxin-antitoxin system antitoxin, RelB/DinJ family [Marinagarivorans sp.]|nr:type II toxin-antitoxin system antitoxin, RelB/DinJ family [Marinagarivorans sp.]